MPMAAQMYPSEGEKERSLMLLGIVKFQINLVKLVGVEPRTTQPRLPNVPTLPLLLLEIKSCLCTEYILLKHEIAHSA